MIWDLLNNCKMIQNLVLPVNLFISECTEVKTGTMKKKSLNFLKLNIKWLIAGLFLLILGYLVLGWSPGGNKSYEETVFGWSKLVLAPIIILLGYTTIGFSIMLQAKK